LKVWFETIYPFTTIPGLSSNWGWPSSAMAAISS